ncbi:MAG: RnfABCDGE type electron transport complex subunit B [Myxococcota bacterium]|jgi:RnfABCDGE-type electron transport complex B subunit|nr:RnfABCDGE type electron transport complex subunit B [Myxococcota bacterium]
METAVALLLAAVVVALLAVAGGWILGWANRKFAVEVDPKVTQINDALPAANCGGCGYVGCGEYAEAVARGDAAIDLCGPGGSSCIAAIAQIMGVDAGGALPYKAVVHCEADRSQRLGLTEYNGEQTCAAANLVGGVQGCTYGCLGLGDCQRACEYDAITIRNGVAVIDPIKCIGCKLCAAACPRNIISMVPFRQEKMLVIACSNKDFGSDVKNVCKIGCIGCKACTRMTSFITMDGSLPTIDYEHYQDGMDFDPVLAKCPMHRLILVGTPSPKDLADTEGESVPKVIEAQFETTVDKTEWRG